MPNTMVTTQEPRTHNKPGTIKTTEQVLKAVDHLKVVHRQVDEPRDAVYRDLVHRRVTPRARQFIGRHCAGQLYEHQALALESIFDGQDTLTTTPTASGKTLPSVLATLLAMEEDPESTALFIYPQKALAADQLTKMESMYQQYFDRHPEEWTIARYDGSVDEPARKAIRDRGQIILTNPDMLHFSLLGNSRCWTRLLSNLKYIVIDEAHEYRGYFGANVAFIIRRLLAMSEAHGSAPLIISASATLSEADEHLRNLTGRQIEEIKPCWDGSPRGRRQVWLAQADRYAPNAVRVLLQMLIKRDQRCLVFCNSRKAVEHLVVELPQELLEKNLVRVYRAGLSTEDRLEAEAAFRSGDTRALVSTSAFELGNDIGGLDVVISVGIPHTMMSFWQRIGRIARNGREGAAVVIANPTPLEAHYAQHPAELFGRDLESPSVPLHNEPIRINHALSARKELVRFAAPHSPFLGQELDSTITMINEGRLTTAQQFVDDPWFGFSVRSSSGEEFQLYHNETRIGSIDYPHLMKEAYQGGIYLHNGKRYRINLVDQSTRRVRMSPEPTRNITTPNIRQSAKVRQPLAAIRYSDVSLIKGRLTVTEVLASFSEKTFSGEYVREVKGLFNMKPYVLHTEGLCLEISSAAFRMLFAPGPDMAHQHALEAIMRLARSLFPRVAGDLDPNDIGTAAVYAPDHSIAKLFVYDEVHGGTGLSISAFDRMPELLRLVADRVRACRCQKDQGCFECIRDEWHERTITRNQVLDVVERLLDIMQHPVGPAIVFELGDATGRATRVCADCNSEIGEDARFCGQCGAKCLEQI